MQRVFLCFAFLCIATGAFAQSLGSSAGPLRLQAMATGLDTPWAIGLLPDGSFLVTERDGRLLRVADGKTTELRGVPRVRTKGQGGLLDVTVAADFAQSREIFLTFSKAQPGGATGTAIAVARLSTDGRRLRDVRVIFEAAPASRTGRHFGSRVVEGRDGLLYVTIGDRGDRPSAQDRSNHNGTIIRITRTGGVPSSNPFVGQDGVQPEIWSYGHRNPQGAGLDLQGNLWTAEHGPRGGDEVNRIRKGANFGWPVISYGVHYSGAKIGQGTAKAGMDQPVHYWDPSIAPSGLLVYSGKLWPQWRGHVFVGSLKFDHIARLSGTPMREVEQIKGSETERVRDIVEASDGAIWFIAEGSGTVWRMVPGS